jgi:hypothetical protein
MNHYDKSSTMLFTCQESRTFTLQHYQAIMNENASRSPHLQYSDPSTDILFNRSLCSAGIDIISFISERIRSQRRELWKSRQPKGAPRTGK